MLCLLPGLSKFGIFGLFFFILVRERGTRHIARRNIDLLLELKLITCIFDIKMTPDTNKIRYYVTINGSKVNYDHIIIILLDGVLFTDS